MVPLASRPRVSVVALVLLVVAVVASSACLESPAITCRGQNIVCPADQVCDEVHGGCLMPAQLEVCNGLGEGATCTFGGGLEGTCTDGVCLPSACGNGRIDGTEECDEGAANAETPEAVCRTNCRRARCGDGVIAPDERCDDGNNESADGCSFDCLSDEVCGNGYLDVAYERCDDGDAQSHDGCTGCEPEQPVWTQAPAPDVPMSRREHALAYDAARGRVVMYAGVGMSDLEDTWELSGTTWTYPGAVGGGLPARRGYAMVTHPRRGSVIGFGGIVVGVGYAADLLEWNGTRWAGVAGTSGGPPARGFHAMTYDAARDRVVVFGGTDGAPRADTWEWDGAAWHDVTPASGSPPGRERAAMAYDPVRGRVLLFGGAGPADLGDTWEWDGAAWTQLTPATSPPARSGMTLAYDAARARLTLFGGRAGGAYLADTWEWDGTTWIDATPPVGADPVPTGRHLHAMTYDVSGARLVLHGGSNGASLGDTWERRGGAWTRIPDPPTLPESPLQPVRSGFATTYDAARGRVLLFGGTQGVLRNDTWEWNGIEWSEVNPQQAPATLPSPRRLALMAHDARRGRVVMFGGETGSGASSATNETWEWDGQVWTRIVTPNAPAARSYATLTFDATTGHVVLFGGLVNSSYRNDVWSFDGATWTDITPAGPAPSPRAKHAAAHDAARRRLVVFGGESTTSVSRADTWEWDGTAWTDVTPTTSASPFGRRLHAMAYDATSERVVLFAGQTGNTVQADLWEWNGARWTITTPQVSPAPRSGHGLVWDPMRGRVWMFGGFGGGNEVSSLQYDRGGTADDGCGFGIDGDRDGLIGCADPDCFGVCAPLCNPTSSQPCDPALPRCGDGTCSAIEAPRTCPGDCGPPSALCGDYVCDAPETAQTCPGDC